MRQYYPHRLIKMLKSSCDTTNYEPLWWIIKKNEKNRKKEIDNPENFASN